MVKSASSSSRSRSSSPTPGRYASLSRASSGTPASFAECLGGHLSAAIDAVIATGDLLSFSRTSDGGAICVFVKNGVESVRVYCVTQEDLDRVMLQLSSGT